MIVATCDAEIEFEGAVYKSDWHMDKTGSISVGSELNRHMFKASAYVSVRVTVELENSDGAVSVSNIALSDFPAESGDTGA